MGSLTFSIAVIASITRLHPISAIYVDEKYPEALQ